jgi:hypothetical protein
MTKLGIYAKAYSYKRTALAKKHQTSKPAKGGGSETRTGSYHVFHEGIGWRENPERIRTATIFVYQFYDDGIEHSRSAFAFEILFYIYDPVGVDDKEFIHITLSPLKIIACRCRSSKHRFVACLSINCRYILSQL